MATTWLTPVKLGRIVLSIYAWQTLKIVNEEDRKPYCAFIYSKNDTVLQKVVDALSQAFRNWNTSGCNLRKNRILTQHTSFSFCRNSNNNLTTGHLFTNGSTADTPWHPQGNRIKRAEKLVCVSPATAISRPRFARIYTRRKACGSSVHYLSFKERLVFEQAPCKKTPGFGPEIGISFVLRTVLTFFSEEFYRIKNAKFLHHARDLGVQHMPDTPTEHTGRLSSSR